VLIAWFPLGWLLGAVLPDVMSTLALPLFLVFTVLLPLLTAFSAVSYDRKDPSGRTLVDIADDLPAGQVGS
jgi:hypothetical protein